MREIKFRAWFEKQKNMSYFPIETASLNDGAFGKEELEEITFMQYTGLKDKNGKEIYEGDIVEFYWHGKNREKEIGKITFSKLGFWQVEIKYAPQILSGFFATEMGRKQKLTIISNIYENKDLLEAKK